MELESDRRDGILTLTLNRPQTRNSLNLAMLTDLLRILTETVTDTSVRVVVLTGAGGAFSSGADVGSSLTKLADGSAEAGESKPGRAAPHTMIRLRFINDVIAAVRRLPQPVIAKVSGPAAGAGANLALVCDLVVCDTTARFAELFVKRGLSLDSGASWLLPRSVGMHKAKELALFGDLVGAVEAERIGLVNKVVAPEDLDATVEEWAVRLAAGPPIAMQLIKRQLDDAQSLTLEQAMHAEIMAQSVNFATSDVKEAIRAFSEKRTPHFEGR